MKGILRVAKVMANYQVEAVNKALNYPPHYVSIKVKGVKRTSDRVTILIDGGPEYAGDKIEISLRDGDPKLIRTGGVWWLNNVGVMETGWNALFPDYYFFGLPTLLTVGIPLGLGMTVIHQHDKLFHGMSPLCAYAWRCLRGQLDPETREQLKVALQKFSHREYVTEKDISN